MSACAGCGADVVLDVNGRALDRNRSLVGRWLPDGTELTPDQQRDPHIRAHFIHHCPPNATTPKRPAPEQTARG